MAATRRVRDAFSEPQESWLAGALDDLQRGTLYVNFGGGGSGGSPSYFSPKDTKVKAGDQVTCALRRINPQIASTTYLLVNGEEKWLSLNYHEYE